MHVQNFDHLAKQKKEITVEPLVRDKNYMQRLDGRLWEVVAYESRTARAKFLSQQKMEWYIYSKKIMKAYFPLPINSSFIDKIISYSMWQLVRRLTNKN